MDPYLIAFFLSRTGTYVSRTYIIILARPHGNAGERSHEKKSNENNKYPDNNDIKGPPPVKVL